jgi:hypothetical protein
MRSQGQATAPDAVDHADEISGAAGPVLWANTPLNSAREFVHREFERDGDRTLVYYRGSFYEWTGTHYEETNADHLRSRVYEFLDNALTVRNNRSEPFNPTQHKVNLVLDALKAHVAENSKRNAPFWFRPDAQPDADNLIACRNGLLNVKTRELLPHTPQFFNVNCLPFDYDPRVCTPRLWSIFLHQLWPKFGLSPLIDKRAAIISDARLGPRNNPHVVAERLLSISGEDALTIDRKYRDPWTGAFNVRFLILTNELPRIADRSDALVSRFVLLTLVESFLGREDLRLTDKLLKDLPGILNWSLRLISSSSLT